MIQPGVKNETILSIDTAIEGGSISVIKNGSEIDFRIGETKISKAEEVLEQIRILLKENNIKKESVKLIIVSEGPGSVTGIKIGLSLAKGLARAFSCLLFSVSTLVALLSKADQSLEGRIITAVPVGKNLIAWQSFENESSGLSEYFNAPQTSDSSDFFAELKSGEYSQAILHRSVFSLIALNHLQFDALVVDAGLNTAFLSAIAQKQIKYIAYCASDNEI